MLYVPLADISYFCNEKSSRKRSSVLRIVKHPAFETIFISVRNLLGKCRTVKNLDLVPSRCMIYLGFFLWINEAYMQLRGALTNVLSRTFSARDGILDVYEAGLYICIFRHIESFIVKSCRKGSMLSAFPNATPICWPPIECNELLACFIFVRTSHSCCIEFGILVNAIWIRYPLLTSRFELRRCFIADIIHVYWILSFILSTHQWWLCYTSFVKHFFFILFVIVSISMQIFLLSDILMVNFFFRTLEIVVIIMAAGCSIYTIACYFGRSQVLNVHIVGNVCVWTVSFLVMDTVAILSLFTGAWNVYSSTLETCLICESISPVSLA